MRPRAASAADGRSRDDERLSRTRSRVALPPAERGDYFVVSPETRRGTPVNAADEVAHHDLVVRVRDDLDQPVVRDVAEARVAPVPERAPERHVRDGGDDGVAVAAGHVARGAAEVRRRAVVGRVRHRVARLVDEHAGDVERRLVHLLVLLAARRRVAGAPGVRRVVVVAEAAPRRVGRGEQAPAVDVPHAGLDGRPERGVHALDAAVDHARNGVEVGARRVAVGGARRRQERQRHKSIHDASRAAHPSSQAANESFAIVLHGKIEVMNAALM